MSFILVPLVSFAAVSVIEAVKAVRKAERDGKASEDAALLRATLNRWALINSSTSTSFSGKLKDVEAWLRLIQHICHQNRLPAEKHTDAAIFFLGGPLEMTMKMRRDKYLKTSKAEIWTWDRFRVSLIEEVTKEDPQGRDIPSATEGDQGTHTIDPVGDVGAGVAGSENHLNGCDLPDGGSKEDGSTGGSARPDADAAAEGASDGGNWSGLVNAAKMLGEKAATTALSAGANAAARAVVVGAIRAVGWGVLGVVKRSAAAALQSAIWRARTGGLFSVLTSVGMTGNLPLGVVLVLGVVVDIGLTYCVVPRVNSWWNKWNEG